MKKITATLFSGIACAMLALPSLAVTPAQEKAFLDSYRKAFASKDLKTLHGMIYSTSADPLVLEAYKLFIAGDPKAKIKSITLIDLTAQDARELESATLPDGRPMKWTLKPIKKLVIKTTTNAGSGHSTDSSDFLVSEHDGKLVFPIPASDK